MNKHDITVDLIEQLFDSDAPGVERLMRDVVGEVEEADEEDAERFDGME